MARKETVSFQEFVLQFERLLRQGEAVEVVRLDTEYLRALEAYIDDVRNRIGTMDEVTFDSFRESLATELNRLQKMKNVASYKKAKHKQKTFNDGWE